MSYKPTEDVVVDDGGLASDPVRSPYPQEEDANVAEERGELLEVLQRLREENKALKDQLAENQKESLGMEAVLTCLRDKLDIKKQLVAREKAVSNQLKACLQDVLRSLPTQTPFFESGRTRLHQTPAVLTSSASGTRNSAAVLFAKPFSETPRITAWVSQTNSNSAIHKIPQSSISNVSRTGFQVIPGPDWESEFHVDWLAFAQPVVDGKLAGLIQLIEASPATLTPELERNISGCLARPGGVNQADMTGTTLLHAAGHSGNFPLVKWLLGKGANLESADKHGWTPLLSALSNGHTDIALLLLHKGADPTVTSDEGTHGLHYLCKLKSTSGLQNESYRTVFNIIFKSGVDPKAPSSSGDHCLLLAAKTANLIALNELLVTCQMNPNTFDSRGLSPLHIAVCSRNFEMAKLLLANGASPTLQSSVGIPLEMVMQTGYPEWIEAFRNAQQTLVIPVYTVTEILALLPPRDLYRCRRVCKDFRILADEIIARPSYWSNLKLSKECYVNSAAMLRQFSVGIQDFVQPDPPAVPVGSAPEYDYLFKFLLIGDIRAGKKELMQCFVRHSFQNSENPEFVVKTVKCNERIIKLQVWKHTPDRFRVNNRNPYRGAGLIMICFDLTDRETFDNVKNWFREVQRYASENVRVVLVGMKSDLPNHAVTTTDITALCTELQDEGGSEDQIYYVETSSRMCYNVDLAFKVATHVLLQYRGLPILTPSTKQNPKKDCLIC